MNTYSLTITNIKENEVDEFKDEMHKIISQEITMLTSQGFNGITEVILLFSILEECNCLEPLANLICTWMQRNKNKTIEIDGIKITGCSAEDVIKILQSQKK